MILSTGLVQCSLNTFDNHYAIFVFRIFWPVSNGGPFICGLFIQNYSSRLSDNFILVLFFVLGLFARPILYFVRLSDGLNTRVHFTWEKCFLERLQRYLHPLLTRHRYRSELNESLGSFSTNMSVI